MKAHWDDHGLQSMAEHVIPFTDEQTRRLRQNLAERMNWDDSAANDPATDPCSFDPAQP